MFWNEIEALREGEDCLRPQLKATRTMMSIVRNVARGIKLSNSDLSLTRFKWYG